MNNIDFISILKVLIPVGFGYLLSIINLLGRAFYNNRKFLLFINMIQEVYLLPVEKLFDELVYGKYHIQQELIRIIDDSINRLEYLKSEEVIYYAKENTGRMIRYIEFSKAYLYQLRDLSKYYFFNTINRNQISDTLKDKLFIEDKVRAAKELKRFYQLNYKKYCNFQIDRFLCWEQVFDKSKYE
ncbi:hypothetical protein HMPREF2758_06840 [Facklamia sp. HMSC062C11]|uniref:hypothetical protein n=1 Tax=Facklamia sp. HMSC062C11 TaxID=1739262 RepID=UPI0008A3B9F6|nr:hypothetical protein [Facklamia sp. HMSC062C11]OFL66853.1 hypothetical protein HMPREF2758_06840 [Facklamia sp. HMSC062C11]